MGVMVVVVGDSGRGAEPHIRWLVAQILSNFAVAAPGSGFLPCLWAVGCPEERTILSAAPRSASLIPAENTDSVNFMNCRAFRET